MGKFEKEREIEAGGGWLPASIQVWKQIEFDHLKYVSNGMHRGGGNGTRAYFTVVREREREREHFHMLFTKELIFHVH